MVKPYEMSEFMLDYGPRFRPPVFSLEHLRELWAIKCHNTSSYG